MVYTISDAEKLEAVEDALAALEEDLLIACLGRDIEPESLADDFTSDDPSDADVVDALGRLNAAKAYMSSL
jgi:hypothetical protein